MDPTVHVEEDPEPPSGTGVAPRFTIVTPCLNARLFVHEAIESVLAQSFADFEYIVVDGGSTDGTLDVIRDAALRFDGRMRWLSESDDGIFDAMNKGLRRACGEFVIFLGADDRLVPDALDRLAEAIRREPTADILCGATRVFAGHSGWVDRPAMVVRRGMAQRAPSRHQSIAVRLRSLVSANGFDTRFGIAADYDLYLRLLEAGCRVHMVEPVIAEFRLGGNSSRAALRTAQDYRDVRVSHGASGGIESVVMLKSALFAALFRVWAIPAYGMWRSWR